MCNLTLEFLIQVVRVVTIELSGADKTGSVADATVSEGEKSEKETQEEDTDEKVGLESQLTTQWLFRAYSMFNHT